MTFVAQAMVFALPWYRLLGDTAIFIANATACALPYMVLRGKSNGLVCKTDIFCFALANSLQKQPI
jgi:hypothetical protein